MSCGLNFTCIRYLSYSSESILWCKSPYEAKLISGSSSSASFYFYIFSFFIFSLSEWQSLKPSSILSGYSNACCIIWNWSPGRIVPRSPFSDGPVRRSCVYYRVGISNNTVLAKFTIFLSMSRYRSSTSSGSWYAP